MLKKTTLLTAVFILTTPTFFGHHAAAEQDGDGSIKSKDEVVYANLLASGAINELYIVNALDIEEEGLIVDYGSYDRLINLTSMADINQDGDEIQFEASEGMFYYQGNINQDPQLPWNFDMTYLLDGNEVEPADLIGSSGSFELIIDVTQNETMEQTFSENYLLQLSLPLQSDKFNQIEAPDATVANAGKNKQVVYTVMPDEDASLKLSADVTEFEFEGIEISALPSSFSVDAPDTEQLTGEMDSLTGAISDLTSGLGDVRSGLSDFTSGLNQLEEGSSSFQSGLSETATAGSDLVSASESIQAGLNELNTALQDNDTDLNIDFGDGLFDALDGFSEGLGDISTGISELGGHYEQAYQALDEAITAIPEGELSEEEIGELYAANPESEALNTLVDSYVAAQTVKGTYEQVQEGLAAVKPALDDLRTGVDEVSGGFDQFAASLNEATESLDIGDEFTQLIDGIDELATNYGSFHSGLTEYTGGVSELSNSYSSIHSGIGDSKDGATELDGGMGELHSGMQELEEATAGIPEQMQEEIDAMISQYDKSDYESSSFVSDANNDAINSVQFVIQTERLALPEEEDTAQTEEEEPGLWQRFLQLFNWA
ncbi:hypothetical protein JCM19046_768 [Bacillus sp. JCM 19046]|nr:hypothetical protein JCM19045_2386 [Bacillus sp. JCM 19045]GAF16340.1 hypothetical protein JCM19046_768 [Bacillus sp. JCM 19046]